MKAIINYTGFRQSEKQRSGFEDGYWRHVRKFAGPNVTTLHPRDWNDNVETSAKMLARQGVREVAVLSYSHGQAAAVAFAKHAEKLGIEVGLWLACDPVYRPTWLPRWSGMQFLAFRAMLKNGEIKVPENINRVVYIRQTKNRPNGHDLIATHPKQEIVLDTILLDYRHDQIDNAPEWWELVGREVENWV